MRRWQREHGGKAVKGNEFIIASLRPAHIIRNFHDRIGCFAFRLSCWSTAKGHHFIFILGVRKKTNWNILSTLHIKGNYLSILHFQIFKVQGCNKMLDYQNVLYL